MADPPITPAPVPPSIAGIPQPVFDSGDAATPATPIPITGSPIIPPPTIGNPVGVPVFPPVDPDTAPVPVPVGPLVGPAVGPAQVPPSLPGVVQPVYQTGSATVPASLFPDFTTTPPSPPIVFANIAQIGDTPPPQTSGQTPPPIVPSAVATIPQLPWNPNPTPEPPPLNTVPPSTVLLTDAYVGAQAISNTTGTWTGTGGTITYTRQWERNGSPIAGATAVSYTFVVADVGALIRCNITASDSNGVASAASNEVGPVLAAVPPVNTVPPAVSGGTVVGNVLTRTNGTWTGNPTPTYATVWRRDGVTIAGATAATYTTVVADEGAMIGVLVTATNAGGSANAPSNTVGPITATALAAASTRHSSKTRRKR